MEPVGIPFCPSSSSHTFLNSHKMNQQHPHSAPPIMAADWSQLPKDLLQIISSKLDSEFDQLRIRSVCSSWRSSIPKNNNHLQKNHRILTLPSKFPIPYTFHDSNTTFPLSKRSIFLITPPPNQQTLNHPWLIKIGPDSRDRTHLWNPLSRDKQLPLHFPYVIDVTQHRFLNLGHEFVIGDFPSQPPSFFSGNSFYIEKVVVADRWRNGKDFVLFTIHSSGKLAILRCGDKSWTIIHEEIMWGYHDVCVFNGMLIAVNQIGFTVTVGPDLSLKLVARAVFKGDKSFLVESDGDLLLVVRYLSNVFHDSVLDVDGEGFYDGAVRFKVFRLDVEKKKWVEVRNMGDRVLFLGEDSVFSASASDLCIGNGNCVIFRDDILYNVCPTDLGISVFHLDQCRTLPLSDFPCYAKLLCPPPEWVGMRIDNSRVCVLD